jgi:hypothetical protein
LILIPLHAKGFHLVTGQRPAAEPQGEQGPRPALDLDTLPEPKPTAHFFLSFLSFLPRKISAVSLDTMQRNKSQPRLV